MDAICVSSIHNYLHRMNLSRKNLYFVHHDQDLADQDEYLQSIRHIAPDKFIDIDGMCQNPKDFQPKKGWSTVGTHAVYTQIVIGITTVPVVAAYTPFGFLAWELYYDSVTGAHIADFIERKVKPFLSEDSFGIFDNASNQRTELARDAMEDAFSGRYRFCPAYSPWLKPIERGFSNVKRMIQKNDIEGQVNPIGLINRCFHHYSFEGEGGFEGDIYMSLNVTYQQLIKFNINFYFKSCPFQLSIIGTHTSLIIANLWRSLIFKFLVLYIVFHIYS
jgi:transposase